MTREMLIQMLGEYKKYSSRERYLQTRERELIWLAEKMKTSAVEDAVHITPGYTPGGGGGNRISKPTERLAIMFADGAVPDTVKDVLEALRECREEMQELRAVTESVRSWTEVLNERERTIVELKAIEGCTWAETLSTYSERFPNEVYNRQSLKNRFDVGIRKMLEIMG